MAPSDFLAYLDECVATTQQCSSSLSTTITKLHPGVEDLPRLTKILRNKHRYLVLPEPTVSAHKHVLSQHLAPQIDTLITKSESNIEAQRTKIKRLEERLSLLEQAKLPVLPDETASVEDSRHAGDDSDAMEDKLQGVDLKEINPAQRRKIMLLKGKRARLEKERQQLRL